MNINQLLKLMVKNSENYVFKKLKDPRGFNAVAVSLEIRNATKDEVRLYSAHGNGLMYENYLYTELSEMIKSDSIWPTAKIFVDDKEVLYAYHRGVLGMGTCLILSVDKKTMVERLKEFLSK